MSKVKITFDLKELRALSNLLYNPDFETANPASPLYVDPEYLMRFRRYVCHGLNLLEFEGDHDCNFLHEFVEVVDG